MTVALLAELDSRAIAAREGLGSTTRLLPGMLQLSAGEARTRVEHAAMVGTRRTITSPGCERPPGLCAAHHARHWAAGGDTSAAKQDTLLDVPM